MSVTLWQSQPSCDQSLQREYFSAEELFAGMCKRLDGLSIESIGQLGLPQPDIVIPKVLNSIYTPVVFIH
jgi:hypothetical protein